MAEFEKWKNPPKANFVISKKLAGEGDEGAEVCCSRRRLLVYALLMHVQFVVLCSASRRWSFENGAF